MDYKYMQGWKVGETREWKLPRKTNWLEAGIAILVVTAFWLLVGSLSLGIIKV